MIIAAKKGKMCRRAELEEWVQVGFVQFLPDEGKNGILLVARDLETPTKDVGTMHLADYRDLRLLNDKGEQLRFFK